MNAAESYNMLRFLWLPLMAEWDESTHGGADFAFSI